MKEWAADPWFDTVSAALAIVGVALALREARKPIPGWVGIALAALLLVVGAFSAIVSAAVSSNGSVVHALVLLAVIGIAGTIAAKSEERPPSS